MKPRRNERFSDATLAGARLLRSLLHRAPAEAGNRFEIAMFFYGPNIHPRQEYQLRLRDQRRLCRENGVELIEGAYQPADWGRAIAPFRDLPEGSRRCEACYRLRMEKTAQLAAARGFDFFTVTLTVSRHKNSKVLAAIGKQVADQVGVKYLPEDFKKQDGYGLSVRCSHELDLRRQDYCGCSLSLSEALARRRRKEAKGS